MNAITKNLPVTADEPEGVLLFAPLSELAGEMVGFSNDSLIS